MYILSIIPISRGIPFNTLSYYSSESLFPGTLVEIPLGKQNINGLVYESIPLVEAKTLVKSASFSLKKIKKVVGFSTFTKSLIEGLNEASLLTLTPIGSLASTVINELFFDSILNSQFLDIDTFEKKEPIVSYGNFEDRLDFYKRTIRTAFAEKKSVVLVAPSIRAVEEWFSYLQKGISSYSVSLHSKKTKREQKKNLSLIKNSERPLFICSTPSSAIIPRPDISTIIIEDESSDLYKLHDRYSADMRVVLRVLADSLGLKTIYGDVLPRLETLIETKLTTISRTIVPENLTIVKSETYRTVLPTEVVELIRYCQKNKKNLFIYTNRKGLAPISRCADCGTSVDCPTCGLPIVLRYKVIQGEKERLFVCTHCGDTLPTTHLCSYCGSWNITPVSIGSESLKEAVLNLVDEERVISIDEDFSPDSKSAENLISDIQKRKGLVIVGTQKILPYIKHVDFVSIPFFDRLLSVPSPYTVEEVLRLIILCSQKAKDTLILSSKNPDFEITKLLATKKIQEIIDSDIETRRSLSYPPFGNLIKISISVPGAHRESVVNKVNSFFEPIDKTMLPSRRISPVSMKFLCTWILQVNPSYLIDYGNELRAFLDGIHFPYNIEINPLRLS